MAKLVKVGERLDLSALMRIRFEDTNVQDFSDDYLLVDLWDLRFMEPTGVVGLVEIIENEGRPVAIRRPKSDGAFQYGQRIKLFERFNVFLDKEFTEHDPNSRFTELTAIGPPMGARSADQEALCRQMSSVVCPAPEERDIINFCLGELTSNILQHSGASGVACAQYYPSRGTVEFGIADHGIGLREALSHNPNYFLDSDAEAIQLAVQANTSGTFYAGLGPYGNRENTGNGLFFLDQIVRKSYGFLDIWSGSAHYSRDGDSDPIIRTVNLFPGTLVRCRLARGIAPRLEELMVQIRGEFAPSSDAVGNITFE